MSRIKLLVLCLFILAFSTPVAAHDFWAETKAPGSDGLLTVILGYGHDFPGGENITADDLSRYNPPQLLGPNGKVALVPGAEPKLFVTEKAPAKGTYVLTIDAIAAFGGSSPAGWVRKSKKEDPSVTRCAFGAGFAKTIVNIGGANDKALAIKPVGQKLEIVPLINPQGLKVGTGFPVKVLFDGKPLPNTQVGAFFAGFTEDNSAYAFSGNTNKDGEVTIIPLRAGTWLAKVGQNNPYPDKEVCDMEYYNASLFFTVTE
jgi:uncharacterized GH25 family protein